MKLRHIFLFFILLLTIPVLSKNRIVVSKKNLSLNVLSESDDTLFSCRICCGAEFGNKELRDDKKTPEGTFTIIEIVNAKKWMHDFGDGYGMRKGAYGNYFFRLNANGFCSIGIHGTCLPESIGTRSSEGCIRLRNHDLERLRKYIFKGMIVVIEPDAIPVSFPDFSSYNLPTDKPSTPPINKE